jgi:hypothetical protein
MKPNRTQPVILGVTLLTLGFLASQVVLAQSSTGYAGFETPGFTAEVFAPGLISTDAYEFAVTFTPDMAELYLTRRLDPGPNQIVMSRLVGGQLQEPVPASFDGPGHYEPSVAPDGKTVYFGEGISIMSCTRQGAEWSMPALLPESINGGFAMSMCADGEGHLYFTGQNGLVVSRRQNGVLTPPVSLGPQFERTAGGSAHGYIAPDGSYVVFDAQGRSDVKGRADLYVSFRDADRGWTTPKNLITLNTTGNEMCPSVSPDGRFLFFCRDGDIWWVDAAILHQ